MKVSVGQADNTDRREFGIGLAGELFQRRVRKSVRNNPVVRQQLDEIEDFRYTFAASVRPVSPMP